MRSSVSNCPRLGRRRFLQLAGAGLGLSACGRLEHNWWRGETGQIVRVMDGDALGLDSGLKVRLVEIEAPGFNRRKQTRPDPYAISSKRILEALALGRQCHLYYAGLTRDRYKRALAHVMIIDELGRKLWLNARLVGLGAARVRTWPDNCSQVEALLALETRARTQNLGLWNLPQYRPLQARDLSGVKPGRFVLLEGQITTRLEDSDAPYGMCLAEHSPISEAIETRGLQLQLGERLNRQAVYYRDEAKPWHPPARVRVRGRVRKHDTVCDGGDVLSCQKGVRLTHWAQIEPLSS